MTTHEKFTKAKEEYLRRLRFNNFSDKTIANYAGTLDRFGEYLEQQPENSDLYEIVEQWRDTLLKNGKAPSTVKQYLTNLKIFFGKATKRSFPAALRFSENPVDEDFMPKVSKKPYDEILSDENIKKLWVNKPVNSQQIRFWPRNYAVVTLILCTGLRNKEVLDLTLDDVDFLHREITVRSGKGDKYRIVDAPDLALAAIEQYLDSGLRPSYLKDSDCLFGTQAEHKFGLNSNEQNGGNSPCSKTFHSAVIEFLQAPNHQEKPRRNAPPGAEIVEVAQANERNQQKFSNNDVEQRITPMTAKEEKSI